MQKLFTRIFLLSLIVVAGKSISAQQLELIPSDTLYMMDTVADNFERVELKGSIRNNQGSNVTITWELVYVDVPSTWDYYYCDLSDCLDLKDFPSRSYTLSAGDTADGKAQFGNDFPNNPYWEAGYGEVHIKVYVAGDSANTSVTSVFRADVAVDSTNYVPTGIETIDVASINVYPNPAIDQLKFNIPNELQNGTIQVYNILGDVVLDEYIMQVRNRNLNVGDLHPGIYFAKIMDESNMVIKTIKFSKK